MLNGDAVLLVLLAAVVMFGGCAGLPGKRMVEGAALGAGAGALVGAAGAGKPGPNAAIGALVGGTAGWFYGLAEEAAGGNPAPAQAETRSATNDPPPGRWVEVIIEGQWEYGVWRPAHRVRMWCPEGPGAPICRVERGY